MNSLKPTRLIFDDDHYIFQAIVTSIKFKKRLDAFNIILRNLNVPIPNNGFPMVKDYHAWKYNLYKVSDFMEDSFIEDVLSEFGVEPKSEASEKFKIGLKFYIYFGEKNPPLKSPIGFKYDFNSDKIAPDGKVLDRKIEALWVRIYPWTTQEEYEDYWWTVKEKKKLLPKYRGKNKQWEYFKRDLEIYKIYLRIKDPSKINQIDEKTTGRDSKDSINLTYESSDVKKLEGNKNIKITYEMVEKAIKRCKKLLGQINLS